MKLAGFLNGHALLRSHGNKAKVHPLGVSLFRSGTVGRRLRTNAADKHEKAFWRRASVLCTASSDCKHKLVFLGTPEVAAQVLHDILAASKAPGSSFEVAAVVSQPGRPKGRGSKRVPQPSPVEALAREEGVPEDRIWCPVKASQPDFLESLRQLGPDLCLTAAYGNILPQSFLDIPRRGTLNIHPSLLPKYRGAAPVQRALQDGCRETGVSVAFTVRAMDAGPVVAQEVVAVDPDVQAPALLRHLFARGTQLLLDALPRVWSGEAAKVATPQEDGDVVHAAKLVKDEGVLDFREPADVVHNKVRAFAGWPGTTATFRLAAEGMEAQGETFKILKTRLGSGDHPRRRGRPEAFVDEQCLLVQCGQDGAGGCIEVLEIQPQGKKPMPVAAFLRGLNGRTMHLA